MQQRDHVTVRLLRKYRGLNPGEVGGYSTKEAQLLLNSGDAQDPKAAYPPHQGDFPAPPPQQGDEVRDENEVPEPPQALDAPNDQSDGGAGVRRGPGRRASKPLD